MANSILERPIKQLCWQIETKVNMGNYVANIQSMRIFSSEDEARSFVPEENQTTIDCFIAEHPAVKIIGNDIRMLILR